MYEFKLCGEFRDLDLGSSTLPLQNITIPYVIPVILLYGHDLDFADNVNSDANADDHDMLTPSSWEQGEDFGLDVLFAHLDTARLITSQYGLYRVTAENAIREVSRNDDLMDILRTEMHLRLLWGAKGAGAPAKDRYEKFTQVLDLLSKRMEPEKISPSKETSL